MEIENALAERSKIGSRSYRCGYCGFPLASEYGWVADDGRGTAIGAIYICHHCTQPTYFDFIKNMQELGVIFGNPIQDIPNKSVQDLYEEARKCTGAGCYTAAVLCCRKLLMHIAVEKGAPQNASFANYVLYLADNHYVPPDAKDWVDHIRNKSNEANHEISLMGKEDAEELLSFIEMLLKVIFEFPATAKRKKKIP